MVTTTSYSEREEKATSVALECWTSRTQEAGELEGFLAARSVGAAALPKGGRGQVRRISLKQGRLDNKMLRECTETISREKQINRRRNIVSGTIAIQPQSALQVKDSSKELLFDNWAIIQVRCAFCSNH